MKYQSILFILLIVLFVYFLLLYLYQIIFLYPKVQHFIKNYQYDSVDPTDKVHISNKRKTSFHSKKLGMFSLPDEKLDYRIDRITCKSFLDIILWLFFKYKIDNLYILRLTNVNRLFNDIFQKASSDWEIFED